MYCNFESNSLYVTVHVPSAREQLDLCAAFAEALPQILAKRDSVGVEYSMTEESARMKLSDLRFTGRVHFYIEGTISDESAMELTERGKQRGLFFHFRDQRYASSRTNLEIPLAFISHDSRDKDLVARPLALSLQRLGCPVWYDEFSLKVGDSLRGSIESGIKSCKRCILILTPSFLTNPGWTKVEFDSVFTRERVSKRNVIVPVWVGVSAKDVYEYSPSLADRVALTWEGLDGAAEIAANKLRPMLVSE